MNITILNGSPKRGENTSDLLIRFLTAGFRETDAFEIFRTNQDAPDERLFESALAADALLFVFPLYVDGIPSHLLRLLSELARRKGEKRTRVYCVINNGFFEGRQDHVAAEQMKLWCRSAGMTWGQAVGVGAGEMLPFIANIPLGHGPNKNLGRALEALTDNLLNRRSDENLYLSPNWSRALWRLQSSSAVWLPRAKKNGLKRKDLFRRKTP